MTTTNKIGKRKLIIIVIAVVLLISVIAWYFYSITASYELKLVKEEQYTLWIGFKSYTFQIKDIKYYFPSQYELKVTSGNNTETRVIGTPSASVGKTFKFLDLEVYIKEALVDGLRIVVKKW